MQNSNFEQKLHTLTSFLSIVKFKSCGNSYSKLRGKWLAPIVSSILYQGRRWSQSAHRREASHFARVVMPSYFLRFFSVKYSFRVFIVPSVVYKRIHLQHVSRYHRYIIYLSFNLVSHVSLDIRRNNVS